MTINVLEYLSNLIGQTNWLGDSLFDEIAYRNLDKLDESLTELEKVREILLIRLFEHMKYNKDNASAEMLHNKAEIILKKHIINESFNDYWETRDD